MTPSCRITIDGQEVNGEFMRRLLSCTVTDNEGVSSDSIAIRLNDDPPAAMPRLGAVIRVWMGYGTRMAYMGAYKAEDIEAEILPYALRIGGRSAEFRGKLKTNRERHWDEKKLTEILTQIAGEHSLTANIDPTIGAYQYEWLGQQNESDIHFVERLAERHDAIFAVKDGRLIFTARSTGKSPSGASLTPVIITPSALIVDTCRVSLTDNTKYRSVTASYTDRDKAERVEVEEEAEDDGEAIYRLGEPFADETEAKRAARSKAKELKRHGLSFECEIVGDPSARAGAPLSFEKCRRDVDGLTFTVKTATHEFSKRGYTTKLSGESQDGRAAVVAKSATASVPVPTPAPR